MKGKWLMLCDSSSLVSQHIYKITFIIYNFLIKIITGGYLKSEKLLKYHLNNACEIKWLKNWICQMTPFSKTNGHLDQCKLSRFT